MRVLIAASVLLNTAVPLSAAAAQAPAQTQISCPIGGEKFDYMRSASAPAGMRPDGRPYGTGTFPTPLPVCPGNGLVLYKNYEAAEVARLEPFVASDAYKAMVAEDTPYYRAYRLMGELDEAPDDRLSALIAATWEADGKPDLRKRYLGELAEAAGAAPPRPADPRWISLQGRAINALRELGRFDEAEARLATLSLASLEEPLAASQEAADAARSRTALLSHIVALKAVVARRDASAEPFELIPRSVAMARCAAGGTLEAAQKAFCDAPDVKAAARKGDGPSEAELRALKRSREEAGR